MKTSTLKHLGLSLALAATAALPLAAQAEEGPWLVRLRAVNLDSANKDNTGLNLSINNKVIPEFDISYFFTPELAAELVLTYPQKQTIRSGSVDIGSLKHLPPTLTLQYHFNGQGAFKPYVGAGINYTRFSQVQFHPAVVAALQPSISKNSVGLALQAGLDYKLNDSTYLNFDIKKVQIRTDVKSAGTKVGEFKVDPWLIGAGAGWRF
ncbi:OmpW family outer membrane protein [Chitinimonas viridis]|uniref:OmpW family outer membrane protein n=1 Tax=Chitinimonas viridis TaxID=664880 RepID=A0ABT8B7X2_9NEIS|nr:OmpW family outer membrane protein [Chitinimonas viridis]MDN3578363.1 OmpW family outer membrane protein [Chitinimonas viridis]